MKRFFLLAIIAIFYGTYAQTQIEKSLPIDDARLFSTGAMTASIEPSSFDADSKSSSTTQTEMLSTSMPDPLLERLTAIGDELSTTRSVVQCASNDGLTMSSSLDISTSALPEMGSPSLPPFDSYGLELPPTLANTIAPSASDLSKTFELSLVDSSSLEPPMSTPQLLSLPASASKSPPSINTASSTSPMILGITSSARLPSPKSVPTFDRKPSDSTSTESPTPRLHTTLNGTPSALGCRKACSVFLTNINNSIASTSMCFTTACSHITARGVKAQDACPMPTLALYDVAASYSTAGHSIPAWMATPPDTGGDPLGDFSGDSELNEEDFDPVESGFAVPGTDLDAPTSQPTFADPTRGDTMHSETSLDMPETTS